MSEMDLAGLDKIIDQHGRWGKLTFADLYDTFLYDTLDTLTACVDELEAENKRLKEALEEIQGYGEVEVNPQHDRDVGNDLNACVRIARKALANKTEKAKSMDALLKEMTEGQDEQR
jgi:hypothetical protein